jgi:ribonuclease-3
VDPISPIEHNLSYTFKNKMLLEEAQRHSSFVNEAPDNGLRDNERLEFLGDAVLNLVVGHILMARFPGFAEGDLTRMRAGLVNENQLAGLARDLNLGSGLQLGKGEAQTGGHAKNSILAGALEALTAAVYLDGGLDAAFAVVERLFLPLIDQLIAGGDHVDFKSRLQELIQARPGAKPHYSVVGEAGPDHAKTFSVELRVLDIETLGIGKSKKAAEQDAACKALALLNP